VAMAACIGVDIKACHQKLLHSSRGSPSASIVAL
jgi:hypothetical protein